MSKYTNSIQGIKTALKDLYTKDIPNWATDDEIIAEIVFKYAQSGNLIKLNKDEVFKIINEEGEDPCYIIKVINIKTYEFVSYYRIPGFIGSYSEIDMEIRNMHSVKPVNKVITIYESL